MALAREVLRLEDEKLIHLDARVRRQIELVKETGEVTIGDRTIVAEHGTFVTLLALALRQRQRLNHGKKAPFAILSLFRSRAGLTSPHDYGLGIDLTRYDGHDMWLPTKGIRFIAPCSCLRFACACLGA